MITDPTLAYSSDKIQIDVSNPDGGAIHLSFRGTIDHANPGEFLDPLLDRLHKQALEQRIPKVVADFTNLTFLNSNGIKSLIKWVMKQMELTQDNRYHILFRYSSKVTWQQTSLKAITYLAKGAVSADPV